MSDEEKNKIIINNYFYIPYEKLNDINPNTVFFQLGSITKKY